jgi:DNA-binding protein HU-beta
MKEGEMARMTTASSEPTIVGKQELVKRLASKLSIPQKQAGESLDATLAAIRESLQSGKEVRLVGFGTFRVRTSAARTAVNPRSRAPIEVPPKERVRFYPGKELAEAVLKTAS